MPNALLSPGEWLKELRRDADKTQREIEYETSQFGEDYTVSQSYLSKIEKGTQQFTGDKGVSAKIQEAIRFVYDISYEQWEAQTGVKIPMAVRLTSPLEHLRVDPTWIELQRLGRAAAGDGNGDEPAPLGTTDHVPLEALKKKGADPKNCYTYLINGDSMFTEASRRVPRPIAHGDIVAVERYRMARENDLVVFWDHESSKMLIKSITADDKEEHLIFRSWNSGTPPLVRSRDQVKVFGVVVWRGG